MTGLTFDPAFPLTDKQKNEIYIALYNSAVSPLLTAKQPLNGSGNTTITFTSPMQGFVIVNDGSTNLTFTINGDTYTVKPNEKFPECFEPFTSVTIVTTGAFRCYGLGV